MGLSLQEQYVEVIEFPLNSEVIRAFHAISKQIVKCENKDWIFLAPVLSCHVKFQCCTIEGKRSAALRFIPKEDLKKERYGEYLHLFKNDSSKDKAF
jgi:hypothetical protein